MKNLLENDFVRHHGKTVGSYGVKQQTIQGASALHDSVACGQCMDFFRSNCQHETLKICSVNSVYVADFEGFVNSLGIKGKKCDFMLYDSNKVALVDSTCSMEHYLGKHLVNGIPQQGKRMKASNQIATSIEFLYAIKTIAARLDTYSKKEAILAYRVKDEDLFCNVPQKFTRNERVWMALARLSEERQLRMPMQHGFVFSMIRYPKEYMW